MGKHTCNRIWWGFSFGRPEKMKQINCPTPDGPTDTSIYTHALMHWPGIIILMDSSSFGVSESNIKIYQPRIRPIWANPTTREKAWHFFSTTNLVAHPRSYNTPVPTLTSQSPRLTRSAGFPAGQPPSPAGEDQLKDYPPSSPNC